MEKVFTVSSIFQFFSLSSLSQHPWQRYITLTLILTLIITLIITRIQTLTLPLTLTRDPILI